MSGRGSSSGGVKRRKGGKNKGTTKGERGNPRGVNYRCSLHRSLCARRANACEPFTKNENRGSESQANRHSGTDAFAPIGPKVLPGRQWRSIGLNENGKARGGKKKHDLEGSTRNQEKLAVNQAGIKASATCSQE